MVGKFKMNIGQMTSAISALDTDEAVGKFFKRLLKYVQGTDVTSNDPMVEAIFSLVKVGIDEEKRYSEKQRLNGMKGGAPKGNKNAAKEQPKTTQNNPKQPKTTQGGDNLIESIYIDNSSNILEKDNNDISTSNISTTTKEIDLGAFAKFWNDNVERNKSIMAQIKTISGKRKSAVLARLREYGRESLGKVVKLATASDFMNGKNNRAWVGSFDWIFQHPNNFVKVLEGNYNNRDLQPTTIGTSYQERPTSGAGKTLEALTQLLNKNGTNTTTTDTAESSDNLRGTTATDYCAYILSEKSSN